MKSNDSAAGLYIHIPFCVRKCPYCDFYSLSDLTKIPRFVDALIAEMEMRRQEDLRFDSIYIGGGTPTVLDEGQIHRILSAVRREFAIESASEITIEANPGTLAESRLQGLRSVGINRINIGVQSFNDANLAFLGRIHDAGDAGKALHEAQAAGFDHIGLDLIYALPEQTRRNWQQDLETAVGFAPEHISAYMLTCEPGTPMDADRIAGRFQAAPDARQAAFFLQAHDFLTAHGYEHYEVSNFARSPQYRSRHNTKYWSHAPYVGLGPAAHSYRPPVRSYNLRSVDAYIDRLTDGNLPVDEIETLDRQQQMIEAIYLGLRTAVGIDIVEFNRRFGVDFQEFFGDLIKPLAADGLMEIDPSCCRLNPRGWLLLDGITGQMVERL